ncbi:MAG: ROK family protein [Pirellulales bacterium]|nr:ROK family protein [Pirellulales bacterium]
MPKQSGNKSNGARHSAASWLQQGPPARSKRAYNRSLVCAALFHEGPRSRIDLQHATGLPLSRLSDICGGLLDEGVIRESMVTPAIGGGRGRPRSLLELDLRHLGVACVRYDQDQVTTALVDLAGAVHWKRRWNAAEAEDAATRLRSITRSLQQTIAVAPEVGLSLVGVGAADPGTVDVATGRSIRAVNVPGWSDMPVVEALNEATGLAAVIERGDGWQALGEVAYGAGRGAQHVLFVTLLEGIGGGIVEGGRLLSGRDGSAGEIGHTRVSVDGPRCGCGGRGCLEAHLAPSRLAALWRGASSSELDSIAPRGETAGDDFAQMLAAAHQGESRARDVLSQAARALAIALGNAISLLNPERVILGGRFVEAGDSLVAMLREALPQCALPELASNVVVRLAELGEDSAFLGIAARVRSRLFAYPSMGGTVVNPPRMKRKSG